MTKMVNSPDLDFSRFGYKKTEEVRVRRDVLRGQSERCRHVRLCGRSVDADIISDDLVDFQSLARQRELMHEQVGVLRMHLSADHGRPADGLVEQIDGPRRQQAVAIRLISRAGLDELGSQGVSCFYDGHGYLFLVTIAAREGDALAGV